MTRRATVVLALACVLALVYPLVVVSPFWQRIGALVLLYAIGASAWNIVGGYAGQVSFGHALFFGCGAYSGLLVFHYLQWPPVVGVPIGIAASVLIAFVIGVPTLRLSGHYFSMATIAVAELVRLIVVNSDSVGGAGGLMGPAMPRSVLDLTFRSSVPYYYLFLAILALTLLVTWWISRHRIGYYLRAIKDSERAARSLGVQASGYKLSAFIVSAIFTSIAGSLYVILFGFVDPDSGFGLLLSVKLVILAALGGAGLLFGPLVGALILIPLEEVSNSLLGGGGQGLTFVLYGFIIVLIACFQPNGVLALFTGRGGRKRPGGEHVS